MEKYIYPIKTIFSSGVIKNIENLMIKQELQIGLNEHITTKMIGKCSVLLDFGKEICGGVRILVCNYDNRPVKLKIRFGESVSEALTLLKEKNTTNDHAPREFDVETTNLCDLKIGNTGFRFVYIEKITDNIDLIIKSIVACASYNNKKCLGKFSSDDVLLNNIFDTCAYTVKLCVQNNYVWDGIKRDRLVWIGDLHPEFLSLSCLYNNLQEIRNSLEFVKKQTELPNWMNNIPMYSMWWLILLNDYYYKTNDYRFILKQKKYILSLLNQICNCIDDNGTTKFPMYFLDWPSSDSVDLVAGVHALTIITLKKAVNLLNILDVNDNRLIINKKLGALINKKYNINSKKQVIALDAIARESYNNDILYKLIDNRSNGFSTFMSYYILEAMFLSGGKSQSIDLLKEYYGAMLDAGATTFWEDFDISWTENSFRIDEMPVGNKKDIHGDFGKYCYLGFRHSLCHGWSSGPVAFLMKYIVGIYPQNIGETKILIKPYLGNINYIKSSYPTKYGVINIEHKKDSSGKVFTKISHPDNIEIITEKCERI